MIFRYTDSETFERFIDENGATGPQYINSKYEREKKWIGPNGGGSIYISENEDELTEFVVARHLDKLGLGELFKHYHFVTYEIEDESEEIKSENEEVKRA